MKAYLTRPKRSSNDTLRRILREFFQWLKLFIIEVCTSFKKLKLSYGHEIPLAPHCQFKTGLNKTLGERGLAEGIFQTGVEKSNPEKLD